MKGELLYFEAPDGDQFYLTPPHYSVDYGDFGVPPIDFVTRRGYRQHGEQFLDYFYRSRSINVGLYVPGELDREDYYARRASLIEFFRANQGMLTFKVRMYDGTEYALDMLLSSGLSFPSPDNNHWNIEATLSFTAFDPFWYNPVASVPSVSATIPDELLFPAGFPIAFGAGGKVVSTGSFTYVGTWKSYPVITLSGPYATATITNDATGAVLNLIQAIGANEQRVLTFGSNFTIEDSTGASRFTELGTLTNAANFYLMPGSNEIQVQFTGYTGNTTMSMTYHARYVGI